MEAARVLGVDRDKVYRLIHGGVLAARKYGRTFRLRRGDVEGVAEASHTAGTAGTQTMELGRGWAVRSISRWRAGGRRRRRR
ncbi:MAG: excisionase family DNA-binding protein [Actinomycetota bacterium]|nr:excisionase family DNA-binding protein [Actinomycetota bacterium]